MDLERAHQSDDRIPTGSPDLSVSANATQKEPSSAIRMRYEAEVNLLIRKIGSLEDIRQSLGLTQRKMCQLLMVDPSAWSRWMKTGGRAPPHIYRALAWYLALENKYPALDIHFWLSAAPKTALQDEIPNEIRRISAQLKSLETARVHSAEQSEEALQARLQASESKLLHQIHRFAHPLMLWALLLGCFIGFLSAVLLHIAFGAHIHF